jgi:hypothetical protein
VNPVRNPGFEQVDLKDPTEPSEWTLSDTSGLNPKPKGTMEIVYEPVHSGKNALKIYCTEGILFGARQEKIPMKPNALYRIGVWVRSEPTEPGKEMMMYILASLYQADGKPVETPQTRFSTGDSPPSDRWKTLKKLGLYPYRSDVPTPLDTAYCKITINLYGDSQRGRTAVGTVYLDDVEVIEVRPEDKVTPVEIQVGPIEKTEGSQR